jgi:hypothetical protein
VVHPDIINSVDTAQLNKVRPQRYQACQHSSSSSSSCTTMLLQHTLRAAQLYACKHTRHASTAPGKPCCCHTKPVLSTWQFREYAVLALSI